MGGDGRGVEVWKGGWKGGRMAEWKGERVERVKGKSQNPDSQKGERIGEAKTQSTRGKGV